MVTSKNSKRVLLSNDYTTLYQPTAHLDIQEYQLRRFIERKFADVTTPLVFFKDNTCFTDSYDEFHKWSCEHYADFWEALLIFTEIKLESGYDTVVDTCKNIIDFPRWFTGATLNYAENCLRGRDEDIAFISANSKCGLFSHSYFELRNDIMKLATALRLFGIKPIDVIGGFLPNSYHSCVAMFATSAIGATWCSASVDFGPSGVIDRFKQVNPKMLFTVEAVTYKGKLYDLSDKLNQIVADSFLNTVKCIPSPFIYEQVPFSHPLFIMFSSGTTGIPKAMVHTVGGTLLKHVEEHLIQANSQSCDRIFFYTTCGWMMWNWLMSFIFCGGSVVLYDESPLEPDSHIILKIASASKATIVGMGAKLYDEYAKMNLDFGSLYDLRSIRLIYSTGSPLKASTFQFIHNNIAPEAVIGSISGGTDIIGCFMGCSLSLPVHAGECQCVYLGMNVRAFDHSGEAVYDEQGELVCLTPFPSMPSHFVGDENNVLYKKAYFEKFNGVWAHGDYCQINSSTGGVVMLGRSDATLNRGGVRIGTAEIYSIVETFSEINDSIAVGQLISDFDDEHVLLFVKMANNCTLTDDLKHRICFQIRTMMSPRHVPDAIYSVKDIPYTNSGKKVELAVKRLINGKPVANISSIRNPEALEHFSTFKLK
ncbi:acetoacetate-CoA ligase [Dictyocaulus viviparus]|uniref:Acetoacetyl-CoA synthetase n=1 Tax=Dictyocaulus viviparus TaxID=29172 RepID=A0A0D8X8N1_DICVI|nr:acetoacetate-CoA ligase [Dictyocaulus viviparus]